MKISYIRVFQMDLPGQKARHISGGHGDGLDRPTSLSVSLVCPDPSASMTYTFLISLDAWQIEGIWS